MSYMPVGSKVTVFADGQGHNGTVAKVFVDHEETVWYQVNFAEDDDDRVATLLHV